LIVDELGRLLLNAGKLGDYGNIGAARRDQREDVIDAEDRSVPG
jgi:hypothetical protein